MGEYNDEVFETNMQEFFFNRFFRKYGENFFLEILQSIHETGLADFRKLVVIILKLSYK